MVHKKNDKCLGGGGRLNDEAWAELTKPFMHQSIPAVPIPPGNSGAFIQTFHPGGRALAFHPITPGHLTISLLSPYNTCRFF